MVALAWIAGSLLWLMFFVMVFTDNESTYYVDQWLQQNRAARKRKRDQRDVLVPPAA